MIFTNSFVPVLGQAGCVGHLLKRRQVWEAYDRDDRSIGFFAQAADVIRLLVEAAAVPVVGYGASKRSSGSSGCARSPRRTASARRSGGEGSRTRGGLSGAMAADEGRGSAGPLTCRAEHPGTRI